MDKMCRLTCGLVTVVTENMQWKENSNQQLGMPAGWPNTLKRSKLSYSVKIQIYYLFQKRILDILHHDVNVPHVRARLSQIVKCIIECYVIACNNS